MRILHDPKDAAARQRGDDSPLNKGSVPQGGVPTRAPAQKRTSVVNAAVKADPASAGTGRGSTFISGTGLSPAKFLTQLRGKLGQRTLLAGR